MNIHELVDRAMRSMVQNGQVRPTVYAEFSESTVKEFPLFNFIGDGRTKAHQLFVLGREVGHKPEYADKALQEICFVSEVWLTSGQSNPNPGMKPPGNVPSRECAMFLIVEAVAPFSQHATLYTVMRTGKGRPGQLVLFQDDVPVDGMMAQAFIAGWRSRDLSDAVVRAMQPRGMRAFLQQGRQ